MTRNPRHIFTRDWWKPKPGPVVTDGRLGHVYIACDLVLGPALFGHHVLRTCSPIVLFGFLSWELIFPLLHRLNPKWGGIHPFGDFVDLLAFLIGWSVGIVLVLFAGRL